MATKEQSRANKENARRSTGPRTADGKAKSSQNAMKHGLRAQATVLPDENLDDFEFLVSGLEDQFQPQTALEWNLLRQLADAEWRMRRVPCIEAAVFAAKLHETTRYYDNFPERLPEDDTEARIILIGEAAESDAGAGDTLSKLSRYEARLSHRYFKALEHLQKIQSLRLRAPELKNRGPAVPGPNGTEPNGAAAARDDRRNDSELAAQAKDVRTRNGDHLGELSESEISTGKPVASSETAVASRANSPRASGGVTLPANLNPSQTSKIENAAKRKWRGQPNRAKRTQFCGGGRRRQSNTMREGTVTRHTILRDHANFGGRVTVPVRHAALREGTVTRRTILRDHANFGGRVTVPVRVR